MIDGKTICIWNVPDIAKGDPYNIAKMLFDAGFEGVCLKGGDGNTIFKQRLFGPWPTWGENIKPELVTALRSYGLRVYIWSFLYGVDRVGELRVAFDLCQKFNPDGYIWDSESRFDEKINAVDNARFLSKSLRAEFPNISQGLFWWALPKNPEKLTNEWHPVRVGKAWLETVDVLMPMMYWGGKTVNDALVYLQRSMRVWESIGDFPMIPVGRAYTGDAGYIDPQAIIAFAAKVKSLREDGANIRGISWWLMDQAHKSFLPWEALRYTPKFSQDPPELTKLTNEQILERLVEEHRYLFPEL